MTRTELSAAGRPIRRPAVDESALDRARAAAAAVLDPEVPVLTIADLGVLRDVEITDDGTAFVTITPTYSGCPAMDVIRRDVESAVRDAGFDRVEIRTVLSPAWTTDWMTEEGKQALKEFGIAPPNSPAHDSVGTPNRRTTGSGPVLLQLSVRCPQCGSARTRETSRFGSTACKSLWVCDDCREPFDHFKAH